MATTNTNLSSFILPFTVLRRLDCVLEITKTDVLAEKAKRETAGLNPEPFLLRKSELVQPASAIPSFLDIEIPDYRLDRTNLQLQEPNLAIRYIAQ